MQGQLYRFLRALHASGLDPRCIERVETRLPLLLRQHREPNANSNSASVTVEMMTLLAVLTTAAQTGGGQGPGCRAARKLLRFASHCKHFADLKCRAEQFRREYYGDIRATRERDLRSQAREIDIDGVHTVLEVKLSTDLLSLGKSLRNCLASSTGAGYHDALRSGTEEFWAIRRDGTVIGVLSISTETRELLRCLGDRNKTVPVDGATMHSIRRALDITAGEPRLSLFELMTGASLSPEGGL